MGEWWRQSGPGPLPVAPGCLLAQPLLFLGHLAVEPPSLLLQGPLLLLHVLLEAEGGESLSRGRPPRWPARPARDTAVFKGFAGRPRPRRQPPRPPPSPAPLGILPSRPPGAHAPLLGALPLLLAQRLLLALEVLPQLLHLAAVALRRARVRLQQLRLVQALELLQLLLMLGDQLLDLRLQAWREGAAVQGPQRSPDLCPLGCLQP